MQANGILLTTVTDLSGISILYLANPLQISSPLVLIKAVFVR